MAGRVTAQEQAEAAHAAKWLEDLLGLEVGDNFFDALGDGVLLCSIINTVKPGTISKVNPSGRAKKFPPKRMENINAFIFGARKLGMLKSQLFELPEFLERKRHDRLVKTVLNLEKLAVTNGIDRSKAGNIMQAAQALDAADKAKEEALIAKMQEEAHKHEELLKQREEQEKKDRETGKIAEDEYKSRMEKIQKEREERERERQEKIKRDKEEIDKRLKAAREAAASKSASTNAGSPAASRLAAPSSGEPQRSPSPSRASAGPPRTLYGTDALLAWLQDKTVGFEGVQVDDFTKSWKDGLAFCALMARVAPNDIDFNACKGKTPMQRLEQAFDVASKLGAPPLLDPEDVCDIAVPDRRSMITYFGILYKAFCK